MTEWSAEGNQDIEQSFSDTEASESSAPSSRVISGFWRRVAALLIDSLFIGLVGFLLGIFCYDYFMAMGSWGRVLGFCIALVYFGVLNSSLGQGKTFGKRVMKIEVVTQEGRYISPGRSFLRYTIFAVPFFLNGWSLPVSVNFSVSCVIVFFVFGVGGSIIYLYVFNRRTRQSLHDLLTGTYVVKSIFAGAVQARPVWAFHLFIVIVICLLSVGIMALPTYFVDGPLSDLVDLQKSLQSHENVHNASAFIGTSWSVYNGERSEATYFNSQVYWKSEPEDYKAAAQEIALLVFENYPEVYDKDRVVITIISGYDIGIASAWKNQTFAYSPSEWRDLLYQQDQELEPDLDI